MAGANFPATKIRVTLEQVRGTPNDSSPRRISLVSRRGDPARGFATKVSRLVQMRALDEDYDRR